MTPWDNPTVDGILWAIAVLASMRLCMWLARRWASDHLDDVMSEPISHVRHVRIDDNGRVEDVPSEMEDALHLSIFGAYRAQVGHSPFCRSADGTRFECECDEVSA